MTIRDLKDMGFVVDVNHFRRVRHKSGWEYPMAVTYAQSDEEIIPQGGMTVVDIFDREGNCLATGLAECSRRDNFCKKVGTQLALGRAIYQLDLKGRRTKMEDEGRRSLPTNREACNKQGIEKVLNAFLPYFGERRRERAKEALERMSRYKISWSKYDAG